MYRCSYCAGESLPQAECTRVVLNQSTHSSVASSTSARVLQGAVAVDLLGLEEPERGLGQRVDAPIDVKYVGGSGSWGRRRS
jgi:hypothetical protein